MVPIKEALTFDDVTLAPKYSDVLPSEVDTSIKLTKTLSLKIPLLSSAMDTVTESKMAIAIAKAGGLGIIHRNLDIKKQVTEIKKVKKQKLLVGAAVGAGPKEFKRAEIILKENIDMIVVDTAHGHTKKVSEIIKFIKRIKNKKTALCAGNIATPEAAKFLLKLGVDIIKVGIPVSMSMVVMALGQLVFNRLLVNFSTDAVAAYQIGGRIDMIVFLPIFGIASALTTIVGMFYGADEFEKIKSISLYGIKSSFLITTICSFFLFIFAPSVVKVFTMDTVIQKISIDYLRTISFLFPFISIGLTIGRILQGLGRGMPSLIITIVRVIGLAGPLAYFFTFVLDKPVEWIWYSMFISGIFATIISITWITVAFRKFKAMDIIKS